jgi:hypothetical protein
MTGDVKIPNTSTSKPKQAYSSPVLMDYGSVATLTLGGSVRGSDGNTTNPCNPGADSTQPPGNAIACS